MQDRDPESGKPAFRWTGSYGRRLPIASNLRSSKRAFGTEITNTIGKRCNTSSVDWKLNEKIYIPKCSKVSTGVQRELSTEQHHKQDFVFGPFTPNLTKSEACENKNRWQVQDLEKLVSPYRPQYLNQGTQF